MNLDPDLLLGKPRSTIARWLKYAQADTLYDDWRAEEAEMALKRDLEGR